MEYKEPLTIILYLLTEFYLVGVVVGVIIGVNIKK